MLLSCILLLVGLALVVFGADYLVEGASAVARRFGLSEFIIGLTIVGMGTSAPEMVVSFIGAAQGNADIAIGNVVGSNIFNTLLILGVTALLLPIPVTAANRRRDIPVNLLISVLLVVLGLEKTFFGWGTDGLNPWDGAVLLLLFAAYMVYSFRQGRAEESGEPEAAPKPWKPALSVLMIVGGLAGLIAGGELFVRSATDIAQRLGWSDKFIAITILAGGTSMPELATCIAAAVKKKGQLALGNIIGSNVFNILLILGGSALIHPLNVSGLGPVDLGALLASAVALALGCSVGKEKRLGIAQGVLFLLLWGSYMAYLIIQL